jgi:23S rRNA (uridine2552-2'-O)-methyltransferase
VSPNLSGIANVDQARAAELSYAAIDLCQKALKSDGVFLLKAFQGEAFDEVLQRLKHDFGKVIVRKPAASRGESRETYVVARNQRKMESLLQPQKTGASL